MKYRIANINDLEKLTSFYNIIIDNQVNDEYTPMWTKDVYPCIDDIRNHLEKNKIYLCELDDILVCALVFQIGEEEMYKGAPWKIKDDVGVIHLLAVNPLYRGKGYALEILKHAIDDNKDKIKTIHLDVMPTNYSGSRLYEKYGFNFIGKKDVYYEDTGHIQALLYEYII